MHRFLNTSPHSPCHRQDNITRAGAIPPLIGLLDRIELRELAAAVLAKLAHEHEDNQSDTRQHKRMQWEGSTRNDWGHGAWGTKAIGAATGAVPKLYGPQPEVKYIAKVGLLLWPATLQELGVN